MCPASRSAFAERIRGLLGALAGPLPWQRERREANLIDVSEKAGVRYLHFSSDWVQGAMRLQRPNTLELPYTREMMAGLLLREPPWPREALLIGLGAGSLAKFIYHQLPETKITAVEIDPQVEVIARLHFKLPDDPRRLRVLIGDGAAHMLAGDSRYDYILVDGFDKKARAGVLDTQPFYQACRSRLSDSGLLAVNLLGRERGFQASSQRIADAFDGRALVFPSCDSGNAIAFAAAGDPVDSSFDELISRAHQCQAATGLNLLPTIARLQVARRQQGDRLTI
ncbi:spermidine synthase [Candidatus Accumulibacter phosphatis]|jgi:spermidine synthase|uniref:Spermidine synthase n=1 Tax=Candidatus Accumulibacter phosphatis TaxID=327160 RepID=A0ABX1TT82_9PROT|nr:spermidine synthase [Candidatus Accumulibacter phosphatis]